MNKSKLEEQNLMYLNKILKLWHSNDFDFVCILKNGQIVVIVITLSQLYERSGLWISADFWVSLKQIGRASFSSLTVMNNAALAVGPSLVV